LRPSVLFTSPLKRARMTAEIALPEFQFLSDERLKEKHFGDAQGLKYEQAQIRYPNIYGNRDKKNYTTLFNEKFPGEFSESDKDISNRLRDFLIEKETEFHDEVVAIFCHAGILRAMRYLSSDSLENVY